ncbi:TPA: HAD-IC family P-type ATPase [Citrobacter koseri]|nr:HAD-IC family P-type ATPase [Citrobacter koseri]
MPNKNRLHSAPCVEKKPYQQSVNEVLEKKQSQPSGLTQNEASARLAQHGPNALPEKAGKPAWLRFLAHFHDVLIYVLIAAAVLTAVMGHWVDTAVILGVAVINALIGHIQENNAEKSLKSIRNMLSNSAVAIRNGQHETVPTTELVVGDIVVLRAGDRIPADLRVMEAHNLRVEEAILTGESTVVDKTADTLTGELPLGDRKNLLFSGTTISAGAGLGVVIATGEETELGHINQMMTGIEKHRTPLLVQMDKLGKAIFAIIVAMMAGLFVFSLLLRDMPMGELLLSLISLAVAAVPEGLPAIISIILSLGVQTMARKRAIIRKLPTVETLGAMSVICSDKTGTLTMNEMTVKAIITADKNYRVQGNSYEPMGEIHTEESDAAVEILPGSLLENYLRTIDLCNDSQLIQDENGHWGITGGPTEGALKVLAAKARLPAIETELRSKIPFDSQYKYMATHHRIGNEERVLVTGAPDVLFKLCQLQQTATGTEAFTQNHWEAEIARYAKEGLRMVAAAWKPGRAEAASLTHECLNDGLIFLGIAGMMDPPRPEAIDAIQACQQADVGIAMGIKGTEVTKEAADMVLTDDNFATIASAVQEGRRVYDNLKKTILFIMPTNLAQGLLIIIALLAGNLIPLTPVLILWMNMATSATLSFGLAFEAGERNIMRRPPRQSNENVMDAFAIWRVGFVGTLIAACAFALEAWLQPRGHSPEFIRTVLLQTLVTAQWVYMLNCRVSDGFSLGRGLLMNKGIWMVSGILLLLQMAIIYMPFMQMLFGTEALPLRYWGITFAIGAVLFCIVETEKPLTRKFRRK